MSISSTLIKGAVCGALLFGNIVPPKDAYIEDDNDFNTVADYLVDGWGWFQLTTVKADCGFGDTSDCNFGGTFIITPDDPYDPWGGYDPGDDPIDETDSDDGSGPTTPPPTTPQPSDCTKLANAVFDICTVSASDILIEELEVCGFVPNINLVIIAIPAGDNCSARASARFDRNVGQCKANRSAKLLKCGE